MISIDLKGAEKFLVNSRKARGLFTRTVYNSLKSSLRKPVRDRQGMTKGHPMIGNITSSPWGKKDRNKITSRVKRIGPWVEGNTVNAGIGMYGYAAAARTGDKIIPHAIPRGLSVIQHPGARVMPQISGGRDFREIPAVLRQLETDLHRMLDKYYGL